MIAKGMTVRSTRLALLLLLVPGLARAQAGAWDDARALALVQAARDARAVTSDSGLVSYEARAEGHVYFYLERPETGDRTLVKADQIALEVYWRRPNLTKQRIVGMRDRDVLPNRMHYHLDHLTVVQDEFADRIYVGEGDEVRGAPHPAAPGSDSVYAFRLADSLALRLPSRPRPVQVYEIRFKPRDFDRAALIGSMFLDRDTGAIVRFSFTFTPASYVDPRLEQIRISLDNGLWHGRYWLPDEQRLEIRRQLPQFDVSVSSVIAGSFRITDYVLNPPIPVAFFRGSPVVALPPRARAAYDDYEMELMEGLKDHGLDPDPDLERIESAVQEIVGRQVTGALPPLRPHIPSVSDGVRYNRAEEAFLGAGLAYRPADRWEVEGSAGYATGPGHVHGRLRVEADLLGARWAVTGYANGTGDLGQTPGAPGALNTLSTAFGGMDHLDPYYATGASLEVATPGVLVDRTTLRLAVEDHAAATMTATGGLVGADSVFRAVRSVTEGRFLEVTLAAARAPRRAPGLDWHGNGEMTGGWGPDSRYTRSDLRLGLRWNGQRAALLGNVAFGAVSARSDAPPPQRLFLLGGYGTLPGYPYRGFAGDRYASARLELAQSLGTPLLTGHLMTAAGWAGLDTTPPGDWPVTDTDGVRASYGIGLGLFWDMLRVEAWNGTRDGRWQLLVSLHPDFVGVL